MYFLFGSNALFLTSYMCRKVGAAVPQPPYPVSGVPVAFTNIMIPTAVLKGEVTKTVIQGAKP